MASLAPESGTDTLIFPSHSFDLKITSKPSLMYIFWLSIYSKKQKQKTKQSKQNKQNELCVGTSWEKLTFAINQSLTIIYFFSVSLEGKKITSSLPEVYFFIFFSFFFIHLRAFHGYFLSVHYAKDLYFPFSIFLVILIVCACLTL